MSNLHTYLPQDRLRAFARGETLPDRTSGAALFADISGFTVSTETFTRELGSRRGIEELTREVNAVYDALITEIEKYGGSVISFAGDAITCWFEETDQTSSLMPSTLRAVTAALALPAIITAFPQKLGLKVVVASGAARRLMVGDPAIQILDALAGATIARLATAEHLASRGEVLIDKPTANALAAGVSIREWRTAESGERFAVVNEVLSAPTPMTVQSPVALEIDDLRPWILPAIFEREHSGHGTFLTELRPATALFLRFTGLDYDEDEQAGEKLDAWLRLAQQCIVRHGGALLQLNIGDKGSYVYAVFGAPIAHEDDVRRAVTAALELRQLSQKFPFLKSLEIGLSTGMMRTGAYGGLTRRTYGALGDEVNLAARLMTTAQSGEILLSGHVHKVVEHHFSFEPRAPIAVKGKAELLPVFAVSSERKQRAIRLQEPQYSLPMVGREEELAIINEQLTLTLQGKGRVIGIVAEAGMGKSRLVAEVIRSARKQGFVGFGGACQSDAVNTPYQAWKLIWQAFFDVDPSASLRKQIRSLENEIEDRTPERVQALPLLGILLNLEIPDNDFTKTLEPKYKQSVLRALLEDCLRAGAKDEPLLIVIEDLHWIDALSHNLLNELARALSDSRVCFVLAYRPPQLARLEAMPNFTKIELHELNVAEAEQAIHAKLAQLYPARSGAIPSGLVDTLMARSQGNPFYLEELLNYVRDRGLDPADMNKIELPDSLHTLILSRIDQLSERQKTTLRVASIIGRLFRADWLTGYYPDLGSASHVQADLEQLVELDITALISPGPELVYLFKHIVTHEVTYESLPFATRAKLHEQLARYLESRGAVTASMLDTITFHYLRSDNFTKQREYLRKAVQAAQAVSAFHTAVDYLARLLELTPATAPARSSLALQLAEVHYRLSDFPAARAVIAQAQTAATNDVDRAAALALLGELTSAMGNYAEAQTILAEAVPLARASGDPLTLCRALYALGDVNWRLGKLEDAKVALNESRTLASALHNLPRELSALNGLGLVADLQGKSDEVERLLREIQTRAVAAGNRERAMMALNNWGEVYKARQDYTAARENYQQGLALARELGVQQAIALFLINLANVDIKLGQLATARVGLREGLALALRLGALPSAVAAVRNFGSLIYAEGQTERALALLGLAHNQPAWNSDNQRQLSTELAAWALDPSVVEAGLKKGEALGWEETVRELLG
jgi:class 3 adenylate cyclase/tetratricopeptide (TPR) repeat protein